MWEFLLPNPNGTKWKGIPIGNSAIEAQIYIDVYDGINVHPIIIDSNNGNNYAGIFTSTANANGNVVALTGLTGPGVLMAFNTYVVSQHLRPISLQGGGSGANTSFSVIFVQYEEPLPKEWHEVHSAGSNYTNITNSFKSFMQLRDIFSASIAVRKNNLTTLLSSFTWAPSGYPITQPTNVYRVASLSKMFTSAVMVQLELDGFNISTKVFAYLGITTVALPTQDKDNRIDDITVQHCWELQRLESG
jgi:hypothetical protein